MESIVTPPRKPPSAAANRGSSRMSIEHRRLLIGRKFRELRETFFPSAVDFVEAAGGQITQSEVSKIETGVSAMRSDSKRSVYAATLRIPRSAIDDLADDLSTSVPDVAALARREKLHVASPPSKVDGLGDSPDQGEEMAAIRLHEVLRSRYVNLELCLLYWEHEGKRWDDAVVQTARAGALFGGEDPAPGKWKRELDMLESALNERRLAQETGEKTPD